MKKIYLAAAVLGSMMMSASAYAVDSTGCGLGSMAWKGERGIGPQVLAATTNGSFGTQTFGITFGTSGCDPDGRISGGTGRMALAFLENNLEQFAMDAAAGHGETIETLAGILNVDSEKLGEQTKARFASIFYNENADATSVTLAMIDLAHEIA
ncbi:MAG: DUF3015 family protein [Alphaproteobacteria bacterium]|nr:DUF3015 family protein [Alphaproteobacteria bacterium]